MHPSVPSLNFLIGWKAKKEADRSRMVGGRCKKGNIQGLSDHLSHLHPYTPISQNGCGALMDPALPFVCVCRGV